MTPAELLASKFLSVIGRSTGDYEIKKKIRKSDMTIETITALIHEHMYDRLNESNNSNDGKEIKHVHHMERPYKRKWTDKTDQDKSKRRPENQRYKRRDNRCGKCTLTSRRKGECDMTSYYVLIYIRAKNGSTDNIVPVISTTIQHTNADLFTYPLYFDIE